MAGRGELKGRTADIALDVIDSHAEVLEAVARGVPARTHVESPPDPRATIGMTVIRCGRSATFVVFIRRSP